jgi:ubiquitin carboxyl-terminal hydrolase 34
MDLESIELSRERAVSSEPCSTRPNPFDNDEHSSRKRQRISGGGSRSRSVDAARVKTVTHLSATPEESDEGLRRDPPLPQTPTRTSSSMPTAEPTSSRVTINLRSTRPPQSSSSVPPSPETPSKMAGQSAGTHLSLDSGDEDVSTKQQIETPSSSSSVVADTGSPEIELISVNEDESEFGNRSPQVAIIGDEDNLLLGSNPMLEFPYRGPAEPLPAAVRKIARFLEYGEETVPASSLTELIFKEPVEDEETFCKLRDWIEGYLQFSAGHESSWYDVYLNDREFWDVLPDIVWSLSKRR